jgi:hypothetical protein
MESRITSWRSLPALADAPIPTSGPVLASARATFDPIAGYTR